MIDICVSQELQSFKMEMSGRLTVKETADGGNCIFRSFALPLKLTKINTLRRGKELQGTSMLVKIVIVLWICKRAKSVIYFTIPDMQLRLRWALSFYIIYVMDVITLLFQVLTSVPSPSQ
jgi:hypothetical protein